MDLPPLLTRSPASPPNSYSPSDRSSSIGYPSPNLVAQQYSLSIYDSSCSMAPLPPNPEDSHHASLDTMAQQEWAHVTSQAISGIGSTGYETFGNFGSPSPFGQHDVYSSHQHQDSSIMPHSPPPTAPQPSHSRSPAGSLRSSLVYASSTPLMAQPMTPRIKVEAAPVDYRHAADMPQYASPARSLAAYSADVGLYSTSLPSPGYLSDTQSSAWSHKDYNSNEAEGYYGPGQSTLGGGGGVGGVGGSSNQPEQRRRPVSKSPRIRKKFTTKDEANYHCEVKGCGKMFSRSYNYKAHMETHDEKREYPFPCQTTGCSKRFVRKTDLQRHHQSVHMKERNHKCDYCSRLFARKDTLRRHMEDGCPKRFDIGTMDLRAESYTQRPLSADLGMLSSTHSTLPPLTMPSMGSNGLLMDPSRGRDLSSSSDQVVKSHGWGR